jgi:hypothetical protein
MNMPRIGIADARHSTPIDRVNDEVDQGSTIDPLRVLVWSIFVLLLLSAWGGIALLTLT